VIEDAAAQAVFMQPRKHFQGLAAGKELGGPERQPARQPLIHFEPEAIVGKRGIAIGGNDEREIVNQMGRVPEHVAALPQGIENERKVKLLEIADAAVHQLRAPA
jgi:hypothetical protein